MGRSVIMTGTMGVMTEASLSALRGAIIAQVPDAEFKFLFDGVQEDSTLIAAAKGAEILITQFQFLSDTVYDALLPELKAVVAYGIGYNSANLPAATARGILVCNVPNYCLEEVAIHTAALMMAEQRRLPNLIRWVASGKWGGGYTCLAPVKRFSSSVIGLFGFGRIARILARMLLGFHCRILTYDPAVPPEVVRAEGVEPVDFDTLLRESDYLSIHVPLLPGTKGIFDRTAFQKMKSSAVLINTARGAICNAEDLYEALVQGEIYGAAIDAYTTEPPSGTERKILELPNVLSTPHVGYYSDEALEDLLSQTADIVAHLLREEDPGTLVNRELWNGR